MQQTFDPQLDAHVATDAQGDAREIVYLGRPFTAEGRSSLMLGSAHLRQHGPRYGITEDQLRHLEERPTGEMNDAGVEYRLRETKRLAGLTTLDFVQTVLGIPVWRAGVAVRVREQPRGVLGSSFTGAKALSVDQPDPERVQRLQRIGPEELAELLQLGQLKPRSKKARLLPPRINKTRLWVYRYEPEQRLDGEAHQPPGTVPTSDPVGVAPITPDGPPTLPLPPVPDAIVPGHDYVVVEVLFTLTVAPQGALNWSALIEPMTGAVLRLRALVAHVDAQVFAIDPVSASGDATHSPSASEATLNADRTTVTLLGLAAPSGGNQALSGEFVTVSDAYVPNITPPDEPVGTNFAYDSRTNEFAAASAYHHCDYCFRLVDGMGFNGGGSAYFDGTAFPVPVDHRGSADFDGIFGGPTDNNGDQVNAQSLGNTTSDGQGLLNFFLADTTNTAEPLGIAADKRVVLHEFGHSILWDHVDGPNYGFAHSAGDSLAAILCDPTSSAPDRFETFPFSFQSLPASSRRRHDRDVTAGWAWGGPSDVGSYSSEQILSTTLFRLYRSIGGDAGSLGRREHAARFAAYLIFGGTGTLTPAVDAPDALSFANALIAADAVDWTSEGEAGGAYHKVIRWAFEKQGLYQPSGAPSPVASEGSPPDVDVYIDDGRGGEYQFLANHWSTTDIWNRVATGDGGGVHEHPVVGQTNFAYVKIKNRGTQTATNIVVKGYHCLPGVGLVYPIDWQAMTTNQLVVANLGSGAETIVGPFEWTPSQVDHECMFFSVSALGDASNIDGRITGQIPEWRLVPNDNNIGQRNVTPVPGAGGLTGLLAAFEGRTFWIRNTFSQRASMSISLSLPEWLTGRGWGLEVAEGASVTLSPGERRPVHLQLTAGQDFAPDAIPPGGENIDVVVAANGITLGGMRYFVDRTLAAIPGRKPDELSPRCSHAAQELLRCVGISAAQVCDLQVRKVNIDIVLKGDCC